MNTTLKTVALLGALTIAAPAAADSYFSCGNYLDEGQTVELGMIATDGPGSVEIYEYFKGERGALLGTHALNAGANSDVRITLDAPVRTDVLAVLMIGDEFVTSKHFHVRDN